MELLIRSQNRLKLVKVNATISIEHSLEPDKNDYQIFVGLTYIGAYKNEERALEVLDEIQRILQPAIKAYTPLTESKEDYKNHCMKTELVGYETTYDIVALPTYVYEMPKE